MFGPALVLALCLSARAVKSEGVLQRSDSYDKRLSFRDFQHPEVKRYPVKDMEVLKNLEGDRLRIEKEIGKEYKPKYLEAKRYPLMDMEVLKKIGDRHRIEKEIGKEYKPQYLEARNHSLMNMDVLKKQEEKDKPRTDKLYGNQHKPSFRMLLFPFTPEPPIWNLYNDDNSNPPKGDRADPERERETPGFQRDEERPSFGSELSNEAPTPSPDYSGHFNQGIHGNILHNKQAAEFPDDKESLATPSLPFKDFRILSNLSPDHDSFSFNSGLSNLYRDQNKSEFSEIEKLPHKSGRRYNSTTEEIPEKFPSRIPPSEEFYVVKGRMKKFKDIDELFRILLPSPYKKSRADLRLKQDDMNPKERLGGQYGDVLNSPALSYNPYAPVPSPSWRQVFPPPATGNQGPQGPYSMPYGVPPVYKRPLNYGNINQFTPLNPQFPETQKRPYIPQGFDEGVQCVLFRRRGKSLHPLLVPYHPSMNVRGSNKMPDNCFEGNIVGTMPPLPAIGTPRPDIMMPQGDVDMEEEFSKVTPETPVVPETADQEEGGSNGTPESQGIPESMWQNEASNKERPRIPMPLGNVQQEEEINQGNGEKEQAVNKGNPQEKSENILSARQFFG